MYAAEIWYTDAVLLMMDVLPDHSDTLCVSPLSQPCWDRRAALILS